jgi:hypothetical protein
VVILNEVKDLSQADWITLITLSVPRFETEIPRFARDDNQSPRRARIAFA